MKKTTHLSLEERQMIEQGLVQGQTFREISRSIGRDATTISKEVRRHRTTVKKGYVGRAFNNCLHQYHCKKQAVCNNGCSKSLRNRCRFCPQCMDHCPDFELLECRLISKPPYVCNGCSSLLRCSLEKAFYQSFKADFQYRERLSACRQGVQLSQAELERIDALIKDPVNNGQSLHHIVSSKKSELMVSERSLYRYVDLGLFSTRNIDLVNKVKYRPRKKTIDSLKVDQACKIGRSWKDYQAFLQQHPEAIGLQTDTVIGRNGGKTILTIHLAHVSVMFGFLLEARTAWHACNAFQTLWPLLDPKDIENFVHFLLTDNGSEFSDPTEIEYFQGEKMVPLYYCDPYKAWQKAEIENNHRLLRRVLPKGTSFDNLTQQDLNLMFSHINSYRRKKLGSQSPFDAFSFFYQSDLLARLDLIRIPDEQVNLTTTLLK